jgi:hypothetical protein
MPDALTKDLGVSVAQLAVQEARALQKMAVNKRKTLRPTQTTHHGSLQVQKTLWLNSRMLSAEMRRFAGRVMFVLDFLHLPHSVTLLQELVVSRSR